MTNRPVRTTLRRIFPDALVGLSVFVLTVALTLGDCSIAAPSSTLYPFGDTVAPGLGDREGMLLVLAAAFAVIVTLDLAFLRHVLCTYTSPRRNGRKRARQDTGR
jgi:hypothetical protein